ncbi:MAG: oligosaccharide flippase family protein [Clostridiaceae bacterium]|nr:oligosaccharide flippase family protein [Clostridiaceae bacterium]
MLAISGGTAVVQVLGFLLSPIITRLYTPGEFGVLSIYTAIVTILSLGSFKYERAIPIAEDDTSAINIIALCLLVLTGYTLLISLLFILIGTPILGLLGASELVPYMVLIPIGVFFSGLFLIFMQWALRNKAYKNISKATIFQGIAGNIIKIGLGLIGVGSLGLLLGRIASTGMGIARLSGTLVTDNCLRKNISLERILWNAKRYIRFPLYLSPAIFLVNTGPQLPSLFIASMFGVNIAGFYGFSIGIVMLPVTLIGNSVGQVFYGEAASIGKNNPLEIKRLAGKMVKNLILIGLVPLGILAWFGPTLFSWVFGSNWYEAGIYARILTLLMLSTLAYYPVSRVFEIFEKQNASLLLNTIQFALIILVFTIGITLKLDSYSTIALYSIAMAFSNALNCFMARKVLNNEIEGV